MLDNSNYKTYFFNVEKIINTWGFPVKKYIDELILPRRKIQFRKTYGWRNICFSLSCLQPERVRGTQKTYSFDVFVANKKCISKVTVILEVKYH